ncbi:MAG: DUF2236 domain-containing protein [Pseudomonadales bacterium]|nr:DUF2236 domain-containing protein [Pseudomonadales bacterium]
MPMPEEYERIKQGPQTPQERIWWDKYSHKNLEKWRTVCDPQADDCTALIKRGRPSAMLDEVEQRARSEGGVFKTFVEHCYEVPGWVDFDTLEEGRRVFLRYAPLQGLVLLCSSLVEGYTLNKPAQVLVATGRLQKDVTKRIYETGQLLHNMVGKDHVRPGSIGHRTLMEVRLTHSAVRQFLWNGGKWQADKYDQPINQEDMSGTVLGFDFMVSRGIERLGVPLTEDEKRLMHYFWRYAGYVLGVREELLTSSIEEQSVLALQLTTHLYNPTPDGEALSKALLRDMSKQPPFNLSEDLLLAFCEFLGGPILARDFHIDASRSAKMKVRMIRQFIRMASVGRYLTPDFLQRVIEGKNHEFRRKNIFDGLGGNPDNFAFKGLA